MPQINSFYFENDLTCLLVVQFQLHWYHESSLLAWKNQSFLYWKERKTKFEKLLLFLYFHNLLGIQKVTILMLTLWLLLLIRVHWGYCYGVLLDGQTVWNVNGIVPGSYDDCFWHCLHCQRLFYCILRSCFGTLNTVNNFPAATFSTTRSQVCSSITGDFAQWVIKRYMISVFFFFASFEDFLPAFHCRTSSPHSLFGAVEKQSQDTCWCWNVPRVFGAAVGPDWNLCSPKSSILEVVFGVESVQECQERVWLKSVWNHCWCSVHPAGQFWCRKFSSMFRKSFLWSTDVVV